MFGGNAVSDEYGIGRHVANLFVTQTYEGQSDIHCECPQGHCATATDMEQLSSSDEPSRAFRLSVDALAIGDGGRHSDVASHV